jgi:hypothetical protein
MFVDDIELSVGRWPRRIARLRHEGCEFLADPMIVINELRRTPRPVDVLTFVPELYSDTPVYPFHHEIASAAVLPIPSFQDWWDGIGFKARNKIRKAEKCGVELRLTELNDDLAKGVEAIYNESPIRQGKRFVHYGKQSGAIKEELSSFLDRAFFLGAYYRSALIGFAKLVEGANILRTVHIIARLSERDKPVMDLLIAKSVELCDKRRIPRLQYGSWSRGGLGAFKLKHGFERVDFPRYFVPLTIWGRILLRLTLHRSIRDHMPDAYIDRFVALRSKWNALLHGHFKALANPALKAH